MDDVPFSSEESLSQALVPYSAPPTNNHHEPSSGYVTTAHQMPPQLLSSPYSSSMPPPPPPRTRKRTRSGSIDHAERNWNRNIGMQHSFPALSHDGSVPLQEPPDFLYPGHSEYASSHPTPGHGFPPRMALPVPPQHHHHYLPLQALIPKVQHGARRASRSQSPGHVSVVGEPGMPTPAPKPDRTRTLFTPEHDEMIKYLKEAKGLSWSQILDFFPGRGKDTIQVRYSTKLKDRDVTWTDQLVQRLRDAMDEHNANMWKFVSRKLGPGITANVCRLKAVELGWATPRQGDELLAVEDSATANTPNLGEQDIPNGPTNSGARGDRGLGRGRGRRKGNQSA